MKIETKILPPAEPRYFFTLELSKAEVQDLINKIGVLPEPNEPTTVITDLYDAIKALGFNSRGEYRYYWRI